jgi:AraC-like DNA-binding protein
MALATEIVAEGEFLQALACGSGFSFTWCRGTRVPPQWRTGPRVVRDHVLYLVHRGCIGGEAGGRHVEARAGDLLWTSAGVTHDYGLLISDTFCHTLRFSVLGSGSAWCLRRDVLHRSGASRYTAMFERLTELHHGGQPHRDARIRATLTSLLGDILVEAEAPTAARGLDDRQVARMRQWLERHWHHRPQPADLARELGYHGDTFARRFAIRFGMSPRTWLVRERVAKAASDVLENGDPIAEIARRWGWEDQRLFSRIFRAQMGVSPREWRRHGGCE